MAGRGGERFQNWETRRRSCPDTCQVGDSSDTHRVAEEAAGPELRGWRGSGHRHVVSQAHSMKIFPPRLCRGFCKPPFKEISRALLTIPHLIVQDTPVLHQRTAKPRETSTHSTSLFLKD